jgi:hypothetical protein
MKNSKELQEFEDLINDPTNSEVKYSIDRSIEASVKYSYLTEKYGKEAVDNLVQDVLTLSDYDVFLEIKEQLETESQS